MAKPLSRRTFRHGLGSDHAPVMADIDLTAHPAIKEGATAFPRSQSAPAAFNLDLSPPPSQGYRI
jgi:hypothetical protein